VNKEKAVSTKMIDTAFFFFINQYFAVLQNNQKPIFSILSKPFIYDCKISGIKIEPSAC
jgi:hypothetical protein